MAATALATPTLAPGDAAALGQAEARLAYHLGRAEALHEGLARAVDGPCPRFATRAGWDEYLAGLRDQGVTFAAHLSEAWREAKAAGDPVLQLRVKAARRRLLVGDPLRLARKVTACAWQNGSALDAWHLWQAASAEVASRRRQVAREADLAVAP